MQLLKVIIFPEQSFLSESLKTVKCVVFVQIGVFVLLLNVAFLQIGVFVQSVIFV